MSTPRANPTSSTATLDRLALGPRELGVVLADGAYPYDWLDDAMEQRIRKLFRRLA